MIKMAATSTSSSPSLSSAVTSSSSTAPSSPRPLVSAAWPSPRSSSRKLPHHQLQLRRGLQEENSRVWQGPCSWSYQQCRICPRSSRALWSAFGSCSSLGQPPTASSAVDQGKACLQAKLRDTVGLSSLKNQNPVSSSDNSPLIENFRSPRCDAETAYPRSSSKLFGILRN